MTNMVETDRAELVEFLVIKRTKALRKQNMARVYDLTLWINYIKRQATAIEVEEYYCEYWNSYIAPTLQVESVQMRLF